MTSTTPFKLALILLCIAVPARTAYAGEPLVDDDARIQFERGLELYDEKKFNEASIAFERAYELKASFKLLFNIAQTRNELGQYAQALEAYRRYLAEGGAAVPAERRTHAEKEIRRLETLVGTLSVEGAWPGAQVFVDDRSVGTMPLSSSITVSIGEHKVSVRERTREIHVEVVKVAGRQKVTVQLPDPEEAVLPPATSAETTSSTENNLTEPAAASSDATGSDAAKSPTRKWTWPVLAVGGAALLSGIIVGSVAVSERKDIEAQCEGGICPASLKPDRDKVENLSLAADILIGVGAAGVVTGIVLFFVEPRGHREQASPVAVTSPTNGTGLQVLYTRSF